MEIKYQTKEESNKVQQESFLKLRPIERIYAFLNLIKKVNRFPSKKINRKDENFVIELKSTK